MPRAQKQNYATRYQLEKLRLDVALKRARLAVTKKDAPKPYVPPFRLPEQKVVEKERRKIWHENNLLTEQQRLSEDRINYAQAQEKLERLQKKEARLEAERAEQARYR